MTPEQIEIFADCGETEMPIDEACIIAECTMEEFMACKEAQNEYRKNQLKTKLKIRQAVVRGAKEGIPNMVKIYHETIAQETLPMIEEQDNEQFADNQ